MRYSKAGYAILAIGLFHINSEAQAHVVSTGELRNLVLSTSQQREYNRHHLQEFLSTAKAEEIMRSRGLDPRQVQAALSLLSDEEIANLAARANNSARANYVGNDFVSSVPSDVRIIIAIVIAVLAALLIYAAIHFQVH
jgi:hypothetical protein